MTRRLTWTSLMLFVALAYAITWLAWLPGIIQKTSIFSLSMPLTLLGGFGPAIAALLVTAITEGRPGLAWLGRRLIAWRQPLRWYAVALILPLIVAVGGMTIELIRTGTFPGFMNPTGGGIGMLVGAIVGNFLLNTFLTGGNEELGWRGFALPGLQARFGALGGSLILAAIWAVWHWPLFVMAGTYQASSPFWVFFLCTIPMTLALTWLHNRTDGSVLLVMLLHGAVNTTAGFVQLSMMSFSFVLAWWLAAALVVGFGWRRWTATP